jgi:hypothetical protein
VGEGEGRVSLRPWRVELSDANAFVDKHHRHHEPEVGHRFSLGVGDDVLRGVAICGRPKAKRIAQRDVLEVVRVATDGTRNACSWLYARAAGIARDMGFCAVVTYTLASESGASLRACGWWPESLPENQGDWKSDLRDGQVRLDLELPSKRGQDLGPKTRWLWLTGNEWTGS